MAVAGHVTVVAAHGGKTVGDEHVVAVGLQVGGHIVDGFVPVGLGEDIGIRAVFLLLAQRTIEAPVEGRVVHALLLGQRGETYGGVFLVDTKVTGDIPLVAVAARQKGGEGQTSY